MEEKDKFKVVFKYFKSKKPPPDLSAVLDFNKPNSSSIKTSPYVINRERRDFPCQECDDLGLKDHILWEIYKIDEIDGLLFIPNPFSARGQRKWIKECLKTFPLKPNLTNLDAHYSTESSENLWDLYVSGHPEKGTLINKLRWVTLGYHHNWNTKIYSKEKHTQFPCCLKKLTRHCALVLDYPLYNPEAAIVNYYHMDSSLGGHTDNSEYDVWSPLFSFSFGQTAIFLIGGKTKSVEPIPIFLRSGDIVVMAGESRLAYHGIPLIISEAKNKFQWTVDITEETDEYSLDWKQYEDYLKDSRININVRQVLPKGAEILS